MIKTIVVNAVPDNKWWSAHIKEFNIFTQGKTVKELEFMVKDALEFIKHDVPNVPKNYKIVIVPSLKGATANQVSEVKNLRIQKEKI
jgi:predicted RNase H-like HicB family nuclease